MEATSAILDETGDARNVPADACFHCGLPNNGANFTSQNKAFCCRGCLTVFELLTENGLTEFYQLADAAGTRAQPATEKGEFDYLDHPAVRERLADYADEKITRVTFRIPAIHCIACVWLLENLFRLNPGVGASRVNFPRKEVSITIDNSKIKLSELAALLVSIGYGPELKLSDLTNHTGTKVSRRLWLQVGVAGFAFGNTMLFSISSYFGLDGFSGPGLKMLFGYLSLGLALPVLLYSAADYWRAAWLAVRQRVLTVEVPIAAGIAALAVWSARDVISSHGGGYFDSLCGLVFFLLCGKLFQQKTYDRLAFDRDYQSFFPLAVTRKRDGQDERVSLSHLQVGNRLVIRNGELIPCDSLLISGPAVIDYSFVTGESEPVTAEPAARIYAGGRQTGGAIEIEAAKAVSQSYLTSLWDQPAFRKETGLSLDTLTNRYSQHFTKAVLAIAIGALVFWAFKDPARSAPAFVSVLIVACPCALALAAPFTLGTALRVLARRNVFLKNTGVVETLARVDAVVFDKTGTLTFSGADSVEFDGGILSEDEELWVYSLAQHSNHPHAASIANALGEGRTAQAVKSYVEKPGSGIAGNVDDKAVVLGSAAWLEWQGAAVPDAPATGGVVHVAIDGIHRGWFKLSNALRPETEKLIGELAKNFDLSLLSGDNDKEQPRFRKLFGESSRLRFNQSPMDKLQFIHEMQAAGKTVMMVGDGLNDAGALRQSDAGVALVESIGAFSPASDVIMSANMASRLNDILRFSKLSVGVVRLCLVISTLYNIVGVSLAARALLSPVVCAILMPLSSITVVAFACGATLWLGRGLAAEPKES